jgi:hypothetical protein
VADEAGWPTVAVADRATLSAADTDDSGSGEEADDAETSAADTADNAADEADEVNATDAAEVTATATDADEAEAAAAIDTDAAAAANVLDIGDDAALKLLCASSWLITYCLAKSGLYPVWFSACSFMSALAITIAEFGLRTRKSRFAQPGMTVVVGTRLSNVSNVLRQLVVQVSQVSHGSA